MKVRLSGVALLLVLAVLPLVLVQRVQAARTTDINGDGVVDVKDVFLSSRAFGSNPSSPKWNPLCDINEDGIVDLRDYYAVCKDYDRVRVALWHGSGGDWRLYHCTPENPVGTPLTISELLRAWQQEIDNHDKRYAFNTVRLAFSFADGGGITHNVLSDELDQVLDLLSSNGIRAILDLHNWKDMPGFFGSSKWIADWKAIAVRHKNDTRILAYEIFNEPFGNVSNQVDTWDPSVTGGGSDKPYSNSGKSVRRALAECVDAIRSAGDNHQIIYPDPWYFNVGDQCNHPKWFFSSTDNRANITITFHNWFEDPAKQNETEFQNWWSYKKTYMNAWKQYYPIWIGEFGMSLMASNNTFQERINTEIINWAVDNDVGFSLFVGRSNPTAREQQWALTDRALQVSHYQPQT